MFGAKRNPVNQRKTDGMTKIDGLYLSAVNTFIIRSNSRLLKSTPINNISTFKPSVVEMCPINSIHPKKKLASLAENG
jgi:hypothetical protein